MTVGSSSSFGNSGAAVAVAAATTNANQNFANFDDFPVATAATTCATGNFLCCSNTNSYMSKEGQEVYARFRLRTFLMVCSRYFNSSSKFQIS